MGLLHRLRALMPNSPIWYRLEEWQSWRQVPTWLAEGSRGPAPFAVKRRVLEAYRQKYKVTHFEETGTFRGRTLWHMAKTGMPCTSIELAHHLYARACVMFANYPQVKLLHGDSAQRLPEVLAALQTPALFWLDGHYSAGSTARGETATPISRELDAVLNHPVKQHVILIDDARCFDGTDDYPHLDELLHVIRQDGSYRAEVSTDIIRLTPTVRG